MDKEDEASRDKRLQTKAMNVRQYHAKQSLAQKENDREKARMRMQTILRKQATLAAMQEPSRRKDEKLQLTDDNEESTKTDGVKIPDPSISVNSVDTKQLIKADITEKKRKHSAHHNKLPETNRAKFRKVACEGPSCVCTSCHKLCYQMHRKFSKDGNEFVDFIKLESPVDKKTWFCTRCISSLKKRDIPGNALDNNMRVSEVPKELQGLNSLEERLISRVTPFMKLVVLPRGRQRAIRGQVINFPTPMTNTVDQLPRPAEDTDIVYVQRPSESECVPERATSATRTYYCCRYRKVMLALNWLKENNPIFHDVKVADPSEKQFSEEGDECQADHVEESGVVRSNTLIPDIPVSKLIQDGAFPVHQLERISSAPVSVFNEPQLELMAFPTLYPNGRNGFETHRNAKLSPLDYFQTRVMSSDARWARHPSYLFWACNIVEAYKLQSSISIALRLRNSGTQNMNTNKDKDKHEESKEHYLTAGDLKGSSAKENPDVRENCYSFMRDIRGTAAHWQSTKIFLFTMLRSLGPPTFFITFSADDHHWKDLMLVLANCSGRNLTEEQVDLLTDEERRDFMASNPVVTARHFAHRFQCLVKEVIKGSGKPIGEVIEVNQPSRAILSSFHSTDVGVREKLLPAFTLFYVPVYTTGSGNCMYNMISLTLTGTEQYMSHLRLLTAYSLITHREHMFEVIQPTARILLPLNGRSEASVFKEAEI